MCEYETWYYNQFGYVMQCVHCERFQVGFGTTTLTMEPLLFKDFIKMVSDKWRGRTPSIARHIKYISLPTQHPDIGIVLNFEEFRQLFEMIDSVDTAMREKEMLDMFRQR